MCRLWVFFALVVGFDYSNCTTSKLPEEQSARKKRSPEQIQALLNRGNQAANRLSKMKADCAEQVKQEQLDVINGFLKPK